MSSRRTLGASVSALAITIAVGACSAFGGQDSSSRSAGSDAGVGAPDGQGADGGVVLDAGMAGNVDAGGPPLDGGPAAPPAPSTAAQCGSLGASLFCDDFEAVVMPNFGFTAHTVPPGTTIDVVLSGDGKTHLLRVIGDTTGLSNMQAAPSVFLMAELAQTGDAILDYDFFLQTSALSYATFGVLQYANITGNDEVGVGANQLVLGQPRDPFMGVTTVNNGGGAWHHVTAKGVSGMGATSSTTIDGTQVQSLASNIIPAGSSVVFGISECGFHMGPTPPPSSTTTTSS